MNSSNLFKNKKIIITGHTGFKGSWLSAWLSLLGAKIFGISDKVPTQPSHYDLIKGTLENDLRIDVNNSEKIFSIFNDIQPDFIFIWQLSL